MNDLDGLDPTSRRVALAVLRRGPVSRAALCGMLGLSAPSLTRLTKPLLASGLLRQGDPVAPTTTGRPALPLDVAAERAHFVGAKFIPGELHLVLTDLKGRVLERRTARGDYSSPEAAVRELATEVRRLTATDPAGIGVSLGASVTDAGEVQGVWFMGWPSVALQEMVTLACGLPCVVENDVNAFTLAEHWFGFGRGSRDFAVLTIGAGVGLGLVCGDELVRGHEGRAGMIGALTLADGRRVHEVVETRHIKARLSEAGDDGRDAILDDVAQAVGQTVGQACLVSAPERVLVSGEGAALLVGHEEALRDGLARYADLPADALRIEALGFDEWARGSAAMAIRAHLT
ncbi:ROK family transcriptional regulator [Luteococcus japonicus]|uniref:ROK n=1 Tax=Luteococcus japonicus LSP_Lj1 TaxID=1255658 RepID=A0A1R4K720_9ACTN|nr:ROK family transcriptional regulator [Luteococcus japonicus]SJN40038.1 ROK [Luteococcus japonicus LSP_Lj1]